MEWYYIVLIVIAGLILLVLLTSLVCFFLTFYSSERIKHQKEIYLPDGEQYEYYRPIIHQGIEEARKLEYVEMSIKSFDGLTLKGKYYELKKGLPMEIMFHGYKGSGERDLSTGILRAHLCNRNALVVDQRAHGDSDGKVITFGIKESKDCLKWIDHCIKYFGEEQKILITGISMGAATVMNATQYDLPKNVVGVLADCGYDSAKNIIMKTIKEMHLPPSIMYPFVKLGARIFGRFNIDETSPIEAIKKCKLPIIFIHGDADDFVPCYMSKNVYEACTSTKQLVFINNAGHGIAYLVDSKKYLDEIEDFFNYTK